MSDEADAASERIDTELARALERQRRSMAETIVKPGAECANSCGSPPAPDSAWCSCECRNDWELRRNAARRNGT